MCWDRPRRPADRQTYGVDLGSPPSPLRHPTPISKPMPSWGPEPPWCSRMGFWIYSHLPPRPPLLQLPTNRRSPSGVQGSWAGRVLMGCLSHRHPHFKQRLKSLARPAAGLEYKRRGAVGWDGIRQDTERVERETYIHTFWILNHLNV